VTIQELRHVGEIPDMPDVMTSLKGIRRDRDAHAMKSHMTHTADGNFLQNLKLES
jgi:hypothetical protein